MSEELRRLAAEPYVEVYAYGASAPAFQYTSTPSALQYEEVSTRAYLASYGKKVSVESSCEAQTPT